MILRCVKQRSGWKAASIAAVALLASPSWALGQGARDPKGSRDVVWTIVGAGTGFGVGLYGGLNRFDDAVNSERKIWTTAVIGAAAGGVVAWLLARNRDDSPRPAAATRRLRRIEVRHHVPEFRFRRLGIPVDRRK